MGDGWRMNRDGSLHVPFSADLGTLLERFLPSMASRYHHQPFSNAEVQRFIQWLWQGLAIHPRP